MAAPKGFPGNARRQSETAFSSSGGRRGISAIVNGSPSISISRRMVLSSLVAMVSLRSTLPIRGSSYGLVFPAQHVVNEPLPLLLTNHRLANHSGGLEHVVGRLKNPLQM